MANRKGFTLIELLVCITILGIITGMSIPVIRNLTVKNSTTNKTTNTNNHTAVIFILILHSVAYGDRTKC